MRFNSLIFMAFLAIVVSVLWILPSRARRWWILGMSILFYASWHWPYVFLMLECTVVTYLGALWITPAEKKSRKFRELVIVSILLANLFVFKYLDWVLANCNSLAGLLGFDWEVPLPHLLLPLGISFYVFEALSYTIDVARKRVKPHGFWRVLLFIAFFSKIIAGPIMRAKELMPQLNDEWPLRLVQVRDGLIRVAFGLFMKVVLADGLAGEVDKAFLRSPGSLGSLDVVVMTVAFALQVYFDFSAYSRIGIGAAQMCGITLVENFNFPFNARNPPEFWNRWHMSLSRWIRDYLFFPLIGGKVSLLNMCKAAIISMVIIGVWHGAGWKYAVYGLAHGILIAGYHVVRYFRHGTETEIPDPDSPFGFVMAAWWVLIFNIALLPTWILFRADNLETAFGLMRVAASPWSHYARSLTGTFYLQTALLMGLVWLSPWLAEAVEWLSDRLQAARRPLGEYLYSGLAGALTAAMLACSVVYLQGQKAFIYFDF